MTLCFSKMCPQPKLQPFVFLVIQDSKWIMAVKTKKEHLTLSVFSSFPTLSTVGNTIAQQKGSRNTSFFVCFQVKNKIKSLHIELLLSLNISCLQHFSVLWDSCYISLVCATLTRSRMIWDMVALASTMMVGVLSSRISFRSGVGSWLSSSIRTDRVSLEMRNCLRSCSRFNKPETHTNTHSGLLLIK